MTLNQKHKHIPTPFFPQTWCDQEVTNKVWGSNQRSRPKARIIPRKYDQQGAKDTIKTEYKVNWSSVYLKNKPKDDITLSTFRCTIELKEQMPLTGYNNMFLE